MEDVFDLPTKRSNVEIGLGSADEARKKAKTGAAFNFSDVNFSKFSSIEEFCQEYTALYDESPQDAVDAWTKWECDLRERCSLQEVLLFLISEGRGDEAEEIQSLDDNLVRDVQVSTGFGHKGWILRPEPGPYDDYQRLYAADWIFDSETGEIDGKYSDFYYTYREDRAFLDFFEELERSITWDMSQSDAWTRVENTSNNREDLQPEMLYYAYKEILPLKKIEQQRKEMVPFYTKLWQEVEKAGRDGVDVLKEIVEKNAALYPAFKILIEDEFRIHSSDPGSLMMLVMLERIKSYINAAPKKADLSENYEELIYKYFHGNFPNGHRQSTYAEHVRRKIKVAKKLGMKLAL